MSSLKGPHFTNVEIATSHTAQFYIYVGYISVINIVSSSLSTRNHVY
jgi:hypothetical protein